MCLYFLSWFALLLVLGFRPVQHTSACLLNASDRTIHAGKGRSFVVTPCFHLHHSMPCIPMQVPTNAGRLIHMLTGFPISFLTNIMVLQQVRGSRTAFHLPFPMHEFERGPLMHTPVLGHQQKSLPGGPSRCRGCSNKIASCIPRC